MNTSRTQSNGNQRPRHWLRRGHRWVGVSALVFVLFLATTGIALNHSSGFGLDHKYVDWPWLLEAYGLEEPAPYSGMVSLESLVVVGDGRHVHVLLASGELVESIDLTARLPGPIERVGQASGRAVLQSGSRLYRSDANATFFDAWTDGAASEISWSAEVSQDAAGLEALEAAWRGPGLSVERILLDLHSGRILKVPGTLLMDIVATCMILLGLSGLALSWRRKS